MKAIRAERHAEIGALLQQNVGVLVERWRVMQAELRAATGADYAMYAVASVATMTRPRR